MRLKPFAAILVAAALVLPLPPVREGIEAVGAEGVILIASFEELAAFSEGVARGELTEARACLTADITATRPLRAIGTAAHMFAGEFDGRGHVVSRLIVMGPSGSQGLFGCVAPEGVVKNVTLRRACVVGAGYVGGIAGYSAGRVEGCRVEDSRVVNLSRAHYGVATGGVAGLASGRIEGCAVTGSSARGPANTGGLCGAFFAGRMERCAFSGVVVGLAALEAPTGGLAGSLHGGARVCFCAGCGAVLTFLNRYAGGAAGGVFSRGAAIGCVFGGPENRLAARLTAALAARAGAANTNFQHFLP